MTTNNGVKKPHRSSRIRFGYSGTKLPSGFSDIKCTTHALQQVNALGGCVKAHIWDLIDPFLSPGLGHFIGVSVSLCIRMRYSAENILNSV